MATRAGWLLLGLPPLLAGWISAARPGPEIALDARTPEAAAARRVVYRTARAQACRDPEVAGALAELAELLAEEDRREQRRARYEEAIYDALDACPQIGLEVLAVDCDADPCLVVAPEEGASANWWNELPLCGALYTLLNGKRGSYFGTNVTCPDGRELRVAGMSHAFDSDEPIDLFALEGRIENKANFLRIEELATEAACAAPQPP